MKMKFMITAVALAVSATVAASAETETWVGNVYTVSANGYQSEYMIPTGYDGKPIEYASSAECLAGLIEPAVTANLNVVIIETEGQREVVFKTGDSMVIQCIPKTESGMVA